MIIIVGLLVVAGLARVIAPPVKTVVTGKELGRPGMQYARVAWESRPIDGVWAPDEVSQVEAALKGGDRRILDIGKERADALRKAGCPCCTRCQKLFPTQLPPKCPDCGGEIRGGKGG